MHNLSPLGNNLLALAVAVALALPICAEAKEEKVSLKDCPEAVQKTIKHQAAGGKLLDAEEEDDDSDGGDDDA